MERVKGFEPSTFAMATRRSSQLSYTRTIRSRSEEVIKVSASDCQESFMKEFSKQVFAGLHHGLKALEDQVFKLLDKNPEAAATSVRPPTPAVKPRPVSLEQRYQLLDYASLADEVFKRLQLRIFGAIREQERKDRGPTVFRETGRLHPGRPYFFVKPQNQKGWLFERSGAGWLVTPAEKIVARDLFLREEAPVDSVQLFMARDQPTMPRVKSRALGEDLLAFSYYEQKLLQQLGLP